MKYIKHVILFFIIIMLAGCQKGLEFKIVPQEFKADYLVTMEMEDGSKIKIELYKGVAPLTVDNFVKLINEGFYDGLTFHRVIKDFMIQGGDPVGDGSGGPGYTIKGEFTSNGVENYLMHERGVISMARSYQPNTAGSQFFIMHQDSPHLNGEYAAFGKVIEGIEVVDAIANVVTDDNDMPLNPIVITKVTVTSLSNS